MGIIKGIKNFILALIVSFLFLSVLIWTYPEVLFQPKILNPIVHQFAPQLDLQMNKINLNVRSQGLSGKSIAIHSDSQWCPSYQKKSLCFQNLNIQLHWFPLVDLFSPELKRLKLVIDSQSVELSSQNSKNEKINPFQVLAKIKNYVKKAESIDIDQVDIKVSELHLIQSKDKTIVVNLNIDPHQVFGQVQSSHWKVHFNQDESGKVKSDFLYSLSSQSTKIDFKGQLTFDRSQWLIDFDHISSQIEQDSRIIEIEAMGQLDLQNQQQWVGQFDSIEFDIKKENIQVELTSCQLHLQNQEHLPTQFQCSPSKIVLSKMDFKNNRYSQIKKDPLFPEIFDFDLKIQTQLSTLLPGSSTHPKVKVELHELKARSKLYDLGGQAHFSVSQNGKQWSLKLGNIDFLLKTKKISQLSRLLNQLNLAIPAPFTQSRGEIKLSLTDASGTLQKLRARGFVNLDGPGKNTAQLNFYSQLVIGDNFRIDRGQSTVDVVINKFYVILPDFDPISGFPELTPDPRLIAKKSLKTKSNNKTKFPIKVHLHTANDTSIRIFYHLLKPSFKMGLNADIDNSGFHWKIQTGDAVELHYLKRSLTMKSLKLWQANQKESSAHIKALFHFESQGYKINIHVSGNLQSPQIRFESEPYLTKNDIISLMIYNRTADELTSFQSENVGGTSAAITDRAVGLFGLWVFASTPIESVAYDSASNTLKAQVDLPGQFQLSLGTNWDNGRFVGLGRHIGMGWMLKTEYEIDEQESVGNVYLQNEYVY